MSLMRKTGLGLAVAATLCWLAVALAMVTADGSPIGPALIAALGFALTITALVVLLLTLPTADPSTGTAHGMTRPLAITLAGLAMALLVLAVVLGGNDTVSGATARWLLLGGAVAFIGSSALIATLPSR